MSWSEPYPAVDARRAPFETLVDQDSSRIVLARLTAANGLVAGFGALSLVVFISLAYPHLSGFRVGWLYALSATFVGYGIVVPPIVRRNPKVGMFLYGVMSSTLTAAFAFLVGRHLSSSVNEGVIVCAASIPIIFARRRALVILFLALTTSTLVFVQQGGDLWADRSLALIAQTVIYAALMFWFARTLFGLSAVERQAKAETEATRAQLAGVDTRRRNFMHNMSHELRTPLNAIIGFSEMLLLGLGGPLTDKHREYVQDIRSSGGHLLSLVDEVLDTGRSEKPGAGLNPTTFPLPRVTRQAAALLRPDANQRGLTISVTTEPRVGRIVADERKVTQILLNLLSNAVKFSPASGSIEVEVSRHDHWFEVLVIDHGPGVDPADEERIFGAFEQGQATLTSAGTGLGLSVARQLAESHGGSLALAKTPGGGATFVLLLPVRPMALRELPSDADPEQRTAHDDGYPGILDTGSALERLSGEDGLARYRARVVGLASVAETLAAGTLGLLPGHLQLTWWPWSGVGGVAFGILLLHPKARLTVNQFFALHLIAVAVTGAFILSVRPTLSGSLSSFLMMQGMAAFTWFRLRRALVIGAEVGLVYGFILMHQLGNTAPVARWVLTMGLIAQGAILARYLLRRLPTIVESENRARRETELVNSVLAEASQRKSEFLASMSHELRTPLNAIIGFSGVLKSEAFGRLEPRQLEYVTDIEAAGKLLLALINDTLDLAKADAGRLELKCRPCLLSEIVDSVAQPARQRAGERGVAFEVELDGEDHTVLVDAKQMARALDCVVQNALAVTGAGGSVSVLGQADGQFVRIEVSDTGHRLDTCDYERIFASFEDEGDRLSEPGSRVAFALAHRIAEIHGGSLVLSKVSDEGARFTMTVPVESDLALAAL